jgi:YesN/AraC family two-component response regulator
MDKLYKLIIVEDDIHIRTGLSNFFPWGEIGFELAGSFANGQDALDFLAGSGVPHVDVILSDIRMPVMDGLELAEQIKKISCPAQIIFLSAYRSFEYAQKALTLNAKNYIVKSTKYDELVGVFKDLKKQLDAGQLDGSTAIRNRPLPVPGEQDGYIHKILAAIDNDIKNATLQSISEKFRMSPVYFSRYFKIKSKINFIDYIMRKKMELAAALLEKNIPVSEVSDSVGYSSEKNFSRAFKRYYGMNPSSFKHFAKS